MNTSRPVGLSCSPQPLVRPRASLQRRTPFLLAACALYAVATGCGEVTALDLSLIADPNVNTEQALVAQLSEVEVTIDSADPAEGLYASTAPCTRELAHGELEICDRDGDQQGELVSRMDFSSLGRLPRIRVEQGGLPPRPLKLALDGLGPPERDPLTWVAAGGVAGVHFEPATVVPLQVPFNLLPSLRPPRVERAFPEDGSTYPSSQVGEIVITFSKAMNPDSLLRPGVIQLLHVAGGQEQPVALQIRMSSPSQANLQLESVPDAGSYRVHVSQGALDTSGRPLDQAPMLPDNQPFASSFTLTALEQTPACAPNCTTNWCGSGGTACPPGMRCEDEVCVYDGCPPSCGTLSVCDPEAGTCVEDCRIHGTYCGQGVDCDQATGLCKG